MKGKIRYIGILIVLLIGLCGCSKKADIEGKSYQINYLNSDTTKVITAEYISDTSDKLLLIQEILYLLENPQDPVKNKAILGNEIKLLNYHVTEDQIVLNFDEHYRELDSIKSILLRAALVRTLCQIEGISTVSMTVNGEALVDSAGAMIGPMSAENFIDNAGQEINTVERVTLKLFYANDAGDRLIETQRMVEYNSNISMEKLVVEQLISGPLADENAYPTINPAAKLINVTVNDRVCYVNLDSAFLNQTNMVSPEITIYSIVNSLVELPHINKVQFTIDGNANLSFMEKMDLSVLYERNLDLLDE